MSDRVQQLRNKAGDGVEKWSIHVGNPYLTAYNDAYLGYTETLKAQAEADKATAEMFVTVASIVTGSLMMATFAQTSLRAVAGNAALNFVCDHNLERTFNAMSVATDNKAFMFALGKTLDTVKEAVTKEIKDDTTALFQAKGAIKRSDPLTKVIEFDTMFKMHHSATVTAAERLEADRKCSDTVKAAGFAALHAAPICTPPNASLNSDLLAKKIELCFYLKTILDSDELLDWGPYYPGQEDRRPTGSHPIPQLPSAPNYPNPKPPILGPGQTVSIGRPGPVVRDRIDQLHKDVFKSPFYAGENWLSHRISGVADNATGPQKVGELKKAEKQIDELARAVRPLSVLELRS